MGNATEIVGEEPNHKNITKTKFSDSRKMKNDYPCEEEIHSNIHNLWVEENGLATKLIGKEGKKNPLTSNRIPGMF